MHQHFFIYTNEEFEDYGFNIYTDYCYTEYVPSKDPGYFGRHGRCEYGYLSINVDGLGPNIVCLKCEVDKVEQRDFSLLDIRNMPELEPCDSTVLYNGCDGRNSFVLNLRSSHEFQIILDADTEPHYYHKEGNIEYYYDTGMRLLYVLVRKMTGKEYRFLKKYCPRWPW